VIAFASFTNEALERQADVVFPAEPYAEKEGTVTHPDGRLQRVRQALGHAGEVRPGWSVLAELCERLGAGDELRTLGEVHEALTAAVPIYAGLTLAEIGGRGVRWQERGEGSLPEPPEPSEEPLADPPAAPEGLRLAAVPSLWRGPEVEHSPSLRFLAGEGLAELSPEDAGRLGISSGDDLVVSRNGDRVEAVAAVRSAVPEGSMFIAGGTLSSGEAKVEKAWSRPRSCRS